MVELSESKVLSDDITSKYERTAFLMRRSYSIVFTVRGVPGTILALGACGSE